MLTQALTRAATNREPGSLALNMRRARFEIFEQMVLDVLPTTVSGQARILDLGGTALYWQQMGVADDELYDITTLNKREPDPDKQHPRIMSEVGDATDVTLPDNSFDIVFSNSVIEHVGGIEAKQKMANEIRRLAPYYYVQTPARSFPVEPHFRSLLVHPGLPHAVRAKEIQRIRHVSPEEANRILASAQLLGSRAFQNLFPDAEHLRERFLGLTKSYVAIRRPQSNANLHYIGD